MSKDGSVPTSKPAANEEGFKALQQELYAALRAKAAEVLGEDPGAQVKRKGRRQRRITEECFRVGCSTPRIVGRGGVLRLKRDYCNRVTCPLEEKAAKDGQN